MDAVIRGGAVPRGRVRVSGAKNSATRLLAAAMLTDERVVLNDFPTEIVDVQHKVRFARLLGTGVTLDRDTESVEVDALALDGHRLTTSEYDVPIRTTYLLVAPQLVRGEVARVPYPGGCPIGGGSAGGRGYDLHIMVWERLGCTVVEREDHIEVTAVRGLRGGPIDFPISTVGGTENALLCASVATGRTEISNAYITPEIEDLIALLRRMGARIEVFGSSHIVVEGVGGTLDGARMSVMPDRIEALTWIVYAIISGGAITIDRVPFDAMEVPLLHLKHAGIDLYRNSTSAHVTPDCLNLGSVQPFEVACGTHPGVISDMQAFFVMLALKGAGTSRIHDYRYPERIAFVEQLARFVPDGVLEAERGRITVRGQAGFHPADAASTDLRGSMAVVLAALCADGESVIRGVHMAMRGYNDLAGKLTSLGADIVLDEEPERRLAHAG
ncbi:UDP-N-acetylglucosamine 1-carboxyvinyltransferase [Demequina maris]|uniref:UDP-N-acetylglucosamine 1-carboxyvinyltransferase n=1 Tax=Demequina maris TaxID=1638982 RepID=UPI000780F77A|nr:UDP-N-acetylglucosamine 1-carboxyvinyltransferase [Demequina maris]